MCRRGSALVRFRPTDMTTLTIPTMGPLRKAWRRLRTMRTAIILLLLLSAGASIGSFFPQRPIDKAAVTAFIQRNPTTAPAFEFFGLFDVFGAWWFMLIYGLLLVSLVGCLVPRARAFVRSLRTKPRATSSMPSQQRYQSGHVSLTADAALDAAENALRKKRFRVTRDGDMINADRGNAREGGSLLFHIAFFLLLVGMSAGKFFGFSGQVAVVEGESFTDTHTEYDIITEGRLFKERHLGFDAHVNDFDVSWYANGVAKDFIADVSLNQSGEPPRREKVRVNHPMTHNGVKLYLLSWGWAPEMKVTQNGKVLYDGPTVFLPRDGGWKGVIKLPGATPVQQGLDMIFFADPELTDRGIPRDKSPNPVRPLVVLQQYKGDLGLDKAQSVYRLDLSGMVAEDVNAVFKGGTTDLGDGVEVSFGGLKQFVIFQVASNPGAPILLFGAICLLVGLIPALYSSRRRVWVRAQPSEHGARLEIAGHALQRRAAFEDEFTLLLRAIDLRLHEQIASGIPAPIGASDG